ncbi:MAG: dephospho-CoA kinase [Planctomycetota bacterium]
MDRAALARVVFDRPEARKLLEGWIHPRVRARLRASLDDAYRRHVPRVVLDVPLLLENADEHGLLEPCDFLVYVETPPDARDARAVRDRGWTPGEVARREATQMPQTAKRDRADVVIHNDGDLDALADATERALRTLLDG